MEAYATAAATAAAAAERERTLNAAPRPDCKCKFAQHMLGDGCEQCNPAKALEYVRSTMADLEAHRNMLAAQLTRLQEALAPTYEASPEGRLELERIQKALDFDA